METNEPEIRGVPVNQPGKPVCILYDFGSRFQLVSFMKFMRDCQEESGVRTAVVS